MRLVCRRFGYADAGSLMQKLVWRCLLLGDAERAAVIGWSQRSLLAEVNTLAPGLDCSCASSAAAADKALVRVL